MNFIGEDIVRTRIGIFDVLYECEERANDGHKKYHIKCSVCGAEFDRIKANIRPYVHCNHLALTGKYIKDTHWTNQRLRKIFSGMFRRCYSVQEKSYRWYGAKGIKISDEWLDEPLLFEQWALKNGYNDTLTIDRIDSSKDYSPENCRWISVKDNSRYKSTTNYIAVGGEIKTGKEWAQYLNISTNQINTYIRKYGQENTIEFIKKCIKNPEKKKERKSGQSYYTLYMNTEIS